MYFAEYRDSAIPLQIFNIAKANAVKLRCSGNIFQSLDLCNRTAEGHAGHHPVGRICAGADIIFYYIIG